MFLAKRKGNYHIFYFQENGKRTSISTKTKIKSDALKFLTEFKSTLVKRENRKFIPIDLDSFFSEYLKYSQSIHSTNTTLSIKSMVNSLKGYFGNPELNTLTQERLTEYSQERIRKVSAHVVKREHAYLSSAFNYAITKRYLTTNPIKTMKKYKLPEKQPLFFSEDEFQKLLDTIDSKDLSDLTLFAVHTGLRQMELLTLQWNQINFKDESVILDNRNHITKSKKIRSVPLNEVALKVLIERPRNSDYVFTYNNEPIKQQFISHKFKKYIKRSGLNTKLNFHSLRHTFASWLVQKGVSIYGVSKLLGHSDLRVTEIYSHLSSNNLKDYINVLNHA